ncbi:efflux RND transporter periplasmic adaptor subunit [Heliorestis acidaminivorans]|uniref:Efflux RND transporter periplasmic adaptor subunit n=1 Tax=Heliorestis acidaminivorans TaxID=553427 RepID=A0A6I0ES89_9FIRM|nr:efflux RND transporter periplasmic adaptor subunit [Heliorestis acidaminivorans]KAB2952645.1 efflux RND transporter periplasmic adaptor subunit [Heliorestis acidaminivorans]
MFTNKMKVLLEKKKSLMLLLALLIVVGTSYTLYANLALGNSEEGELQIISVERGTVTEKVSVSGTVQVPTQLNLGFLTGNSQITSVQVQVGETVSAGQVLVTLDDRIAQTQVAHARGNLLAAEARLAQAREGANQQTIAVQEANVEKARVALIGAQKDFENQEILFNDRSQAYQHLVNAENQLEQARIQLRSAQAGLDSAQAKLEALRQGPSESALYAQEVSVKAAQSQYDHAQAQLQNAIATEASLDVIGEAQRTVYQAQMSLANAQKQLDDLRRSPDSNQLAQGQAAVAQAKAVVDQAQATVHSTEKNTEIARINYEDRAQAKAQLDQVENRLQQAQANYEATKAQLMQLQSPPERSAVLAAEGSVAQARAHLEQQLINLNNLTLRAPIDGLIVQVNGKVGEFPNAGRPFIVLNDSNSEALQVVAQVSQGDVGRIQGGMDVLFTSTAYPDEEFYGKVLSVSPEPTMRNGVTMYDTILSVDGEALLKPGMTVNAMITVAQKENVLFVPARALVEEKEQEGVYIVSDDQTSKEPIFQPVTVGLLSTDVIEITSGLTEGQAVLVTLPRKEERKESKSIWDF